MHPAPSNSYRCFCPLHDHRTEGRHGALRIYVEDNPFQVGWVCSRSSGGMWDFFQEAGFPTRDDPDFDETILTICDTLGIEPQLKANYQPGPEEKARDLLKDVKKRLRPVSFSKPNPHWKDGLYRGQEPFTWLSQGVGMLKRKDVDTLLQTHGTDAFKAAGLSEWSSYGYKWVSEGVIILQRSTYGTPLGFGVRRYTELCGRKPEPKYVQPSSKSVLLDPASYLFGLSGSEDKNNIEYFVVEGEFDTLSLQLAGIRNTVSHGSGVPSSKQAQALLSLDKHLVFISDADENEAGFKHLARIADTFLASEFIVLPGEDEDPDTFVQEYGPAALYDLPRRTAYEIKMMSEDEYSFELGYWDTEYPTALVKKYMGMILESPSPYDEQEVSTIAEFSGYDESHLRSWLFYERNKATLPQEPALYE